MENVDPVVVRKVAEEEAELGRFEMAERIFDQRIGQLGDDIGGQLRADGFEKKITLPVVEILIKLGKVGV